MTPRRTALQLTPLLDLLLIVIFAQYLDVGERDRKLIASAAELEARTERAVTSSRLATDRADEAERQAMAARDEAAAARAELIAARATQRALSSAAASVLEIPTEQLDAMLSPFAVPNLAETEAEREAIRQRLREVTAGNADAVVLHLLTHEELRKRVDLWRLHLDEQSIATLEAGGRTHTFRVAPASLQRDLGLYIDTLPDPKRLVLVLFTYDENARLITVEAVRDRLPTLMERFSQNSDSRFDYADLGFGRFTPTAPPVSPLDTGLN